MSFSYKCSSNRYFLQKYNLVFLSNVQGKGNNHNFSDKKMINFVISFLLANTNASLQHGRYKISTAYNTGYLLVKSKLKQNKRIKVIIRNAEHYSTELNIATTTIVHLDTLTLKISWLDKYLDTY